MALWTTGDNQTATRRNREAVIGRLALPLYDVNEALTVTATPVRASVVLTTMLETIWAVPTGVAIGHVTTITICNTDTVARSASVYLIEPGQVAASVARTLFTDTLQAGERIQMRIPYFLAPNALIRGVATQASVVSVRVDALTYDGQPAGLTLRLLNGVVLDTTATTVYTAPGGITHALVLAATLCNTDTVARQPRLYLVPAATPRTVAHQIWHDTLYPKESVWLAGCEVLAVGDMIDAVASVGALVSLRLTILEVI